MAERMKQPIERIAEELNGTIIGYWNGDNVLIETATRYHYYKFKKPYNSDRKIWGCTQSFNKQNGPYIP